MSNKRPSATGIFFVCLFVSSKSLTFSWSLVCTNHTFMTFPAFLVHLYCRNILKPSQRSFKWYHEISVLIYNTLIYHGWITSVIETHSSIFRNRSVDRMNLFWIENRLAERSEGTSPWRRENICNAHAN